MIKTLAYHGSLNRFTHFAGQPPRRMSGSASATLGVFCVTDARIAAHFTLRRHVINEGYASAAGSRLLRDDPWDLDPDPFEATAAVARVIVAARHPKVWSAPEWLKWLATVEALPAPLQAMAVARQRKAWLALGHDSLCIQPWDGVSLVQGSLPSVETDATTWVAFAPDQVTVLDWRPAVTAWHAAQPPAPARSHRQPGSLRRFG